MQHNCPLCATKSQVFYKDEQTYYKCKTCFGIFVAKIDRPDKKSEKSRYEIHENDVEDKGYQKFVSPITSAILNNYTKEDKGLDFGAGTGPVISKVLKDNDYSVLQYDPYFHNYPELLKKKYNYIACCEVIEHFYNPKKEFELLYKLLEKNATLYCMTELYDENIDFSTWYYKNDPTHVFFYHKKTIDWIKEEYKFIDVSVKNRLISFKN